MRSIQWWIDYYNTYKDKMSSETYQFIIERLIDELDKRDGSQQFLDKDELDLYIELERSVEKF